MKTFDLKALLETNAYPGRGIVAGLSADGKSAVIAYFIMGRSENSRNRVFNETDDGIIIYPFKSELCKDPSLIIYSPIKKLGKKIIVTNGDQTDTIYDFLLKGSSFEEALKTRCFEPDEPNFTPRISLLIDLDGGFSYKMSILKSNDELGSGCNRFTYDYTPVKGKGHFIHTYEKDGNPIPSFFGEPEEICIGNDFEEFSQSIWSSLNENNKISLYTAFIDLASGEKTEKIYNKNR